MLSIKNNIRRAFNCAAETYDEAALIQKNVGYELLQGLPDLQNKLHVLDVGCGTGYFTNVLANKWLKNQTTGLDFAGEMVRVATKNCKSKAQFILADFDEIPKNNNSIDLIFSNLSLQWSLDIAKSFAEMSRVLKTYGALYCSILGPATFNELRQCWSDIDGYDHVNNFISAEAIELILQKSKLTQLKIKEKTITMQYSDIFKMLKAIKQVGANCVLGTKNNMLCGKTKFEKLMARYECYRNTDNQLPLTYQVFYIEAIKR